MAVLFLMPESHAATINILAFGDSLTEGEAHSNPQPCACGQTPSLCFLPGLLSNEPPIEFYPYANKLNELLRDRHPGASASSFSLLS